ncbi:ABC transporter permease [Nakamurella flavida]|uniref:Transport permease protein n=1 Tax=Nakamurella flavida TaxID=363630 RepID=A0A938YKB0_9ACTN|nr:ABC transporter permease [Nakamurella flavida]MBM9476739.1 ABC transporter permease [Nakamurella flavida]MDP9778823.1 ABC-2 type transport system permease protein [Nakamurella flavida]
MSTAPSALSATLSLGAHRGWLEYRKSFTNKQDALNYFGISALFLAAAYALRDSEMPGTDVGFGTVFLAGVIGFTVAMGGIVTVAQVLATEREDGTLLRAKALPRGIPGYLVAKAVHTLMITLTNVAIILLPSLFLLDDVRVRSTGDALTLVAVVVVGLLATVPIGAVIGALITSPRAVMGILMLPIMGISLVSGFFSPIATMPVWGQWIAQVFPVYWVGLGTRSALLPESSVGAELGATWRPWEMYGVLGIWAVVGLVVAPLVLRRVARRQSGSRVAQARDRALSTV